MLMMSRWPWCVKRRARTGALKTEVAELLRSQQCSEIDSLRCRQQVGIAESAATGRLLVQDSGMMGEWKAMLHKQWQDTTSYTFLPPPNYICRVPSPRVHVGRHRGVSGNDVSVDLCGIGRCVKYQRLHLRSLLNADRIRVFGRPAFLGGTLARIGRRKSNQAFWRGQANEGRQIQIVTGGKGVDKPFTAAIKESSVPKKSSSKERQ